ncbi:MAG TPA: PQQ-dependent sugar dehydrogenase [Candidatus Limnocylindrales bacterium]|nr:PQQ-dependent sugar dehydrogenase [Candidatus Limnocylindrales bacterium]
MNVRLVLLAAIALACACSATSVSPSASPTRSTTASTAVPATATPTQAPTPSPRIGAAVVESATVLLSGLEIPWSVDLAPDGRLFLTERTGRVRVAQFDGKTASLRPEPWATVPARVSTNTERGLLGIALDPRFATNGFVYLYYSYRGPGTTTLNRLVRMRDSGGVGVEETVLLDGVPGSEQHDGGRIKFGPDGKLYLTTGDGEVGDRAQNTGGPNGKVLRLNVDGSIPEDDPFPSGAWSFGHRNPQGIAFHPDTGALYETEHGPSGLFPACCNDEVNLIERGKNYGWPAVTGQPHDARFVDPLVWSGRTEAWAPSGATFLTKPGPLRGSFLFTTLRGEHLHRVVFGADGRSIAFEERLLQGQFGRLRDVFELPSGQLLVLTSNRDARGRAATDDDRVLLVTLG